MWIFQSDAFLSIVAHRDKPGFVLVRARRPDEITRAFRRPWVEVEETPNADYRYRATLPADAAAESIAKAVRDIDYDNFKNSIEDQQYHDACSNAWRDMLRRRRADSTISTSHKTHRLFVYLCKNPVKLVKS